jgi:hypothetical protein
MKQHNTRYDDAKRYINSNFVSKRNMDLALGRKIYLEVLKEMPDLP